ncbi:hypothetical protein Tco_0951400 [Tanacetum coccineum]|uniref:Uncharacterized protein n=1 Tax=Tanacetum coccineum TaxID=301880 RepID=A0ABQ5DUF5_9ASTR
MLIQQQNFKGTIDNPIASSLITFGYGRCEVRCNTFDFLKRNDFARADEALPIEMGKWLKALCKDLHVLRKQDVTHLLKHSLRKKEICIPEDVEHESNADEDEDGQVSIYLTCIRHSAGGKYL